MGKTNPSL